MRALNSIVTRKTHLKLQLGRMQLKTPHLTQTNARSILVADFPSVWIKTLKSDVTILY